MITHTNTGRQRITIISGTTSSWLPLLNGVWKQRQENVLAKWLWTDIRYCQCGSTREVTRPTSWDMRRDVLFVHDGRPDKTLSVYGLLRRQQQQLIACKSQCNRLKCIENPVCRLSYFRMLCQTAKRGLSRAKLSEAARMSALSEGNLQVVRKGEADFGTLHARKLLSKHIWQNISFLSAMPMRAYSSLSHGSRNRKLRLWATITEF